MQRNCDMESKTIVQKLKTVACVLAWAAGLVLAGSDGPMMPYINLVGAVLFAGASLWLAGHSRKREEPFVKPPSVSVFRKKPAGGQATVARMVPQGTSTGDGLAIRSRYARELGVV